MAFKPVNSIVRSIEILKALADGSNRLTDICERLQLTKGSAHRLLKTLERSELVKQDPRSRLYCLGPLFIQIASRTTIEHQFLITHSIHEMKRLRDFSKETVNLQIPVGTERLVIWEVQSLESLKYVGGKGAVYPIFVGSAGKALLAQLDADALEILLRKFYYVPSAPNPVKNPTTLMAEVRKAEKQGFAVSFGERIAGSASVSVAIKNYICPVALTVVGPFERFTSFGLKKVANEMKESSRRISEDIALAQINSKDPKGT